MTLQPLLVFALVVLASIGGLTVVGLARLGIRDLRAARRERHHPEPVVTRHDRWVTDRARWDTDYYELNKRSEDTDE